MTYDELPQDMKTCIDSNPAARAEFDLTGAQ